MGIIAKILGTDHYRHRKNLQTADINPERRDMVARNLGYVDYADLDARAEVERKEFELEEERQAQKAKADAEAAVRLADEKIATARQVRARHADISANVIILQNRRDDLKNEIRGDYSEERRKAVFDDAAERVASHTFGTDHIAQHNTATAAAHIAAFDTKLALRKRAIAILDAKIAELSRELLQIERAVLSK